MRVTVKQIDINRGTPRDSRKCPLTRALRRALGYPERGSVATGINVWFIDQNDGTIMLPKRAVEFIADFDKYGPLAVAPFSFITRRPS